MNMCFSSRMIDSVRILQSPIILCGLRNQNSSYISVSLNEARIIRKPCQVGLTLMFRGPRFACFENRVITEKKTLDKIKIGAALNAAEYWKMKAENQVKLSDEEEDKDLCPVDCVKEFRTDAELDEILEGAKKTNSLVVVDFYRTACGSCKYIEQGFAKLCKGAGDEEASVIFLKHNVMDEYEEQSEVAERLKIKFCRALGVCWCHEPGTYCCHEPRACWYLCVEIQPKHRSLKQSLLIERTYIL